MRLFSLRSHFGNSLAFILFVWSISLKPFNLIIVKAPLYIILCNFLKLVYLLISSSDDAKILLSITGACPSE
jgi:hypothetical protein